MNRSRLNFWKLKHLLFLGAFIFGVAIMYVAYQENSSFRGTDNLNISQYGIDAPFSQQRSDLIKTNSWFSSVYKGFPTAPMFVMPGAYQFDESGLSISFPNAVATSGTIFGSFNQLCSVGMESETTRVKVLRYGDWDALFEVESGSTSWQVHMAQGSPIVTINNFQGQFVISCKDDVVVSPIENGIIIKRDDETVLIQAKGTFSFEQDSFVANKMRLLSSEKSYRVMLVPQETDQPLAFFADFSWNNILDTQVDYSRNDGDAVRAEYLFKRDNEDGSILTTLWPHHRLAAADEGQGIIGEYYTSIGNLKLIQATSFIATYNVHKLNFDFERAGDPSAVEAIKAAVREDVFSFENSDPPNGVYFFGTWLGGLASATQIAHLYEMESEKEKLLDLLQKELLISLNNFVYQDNPPMLVAKNTEFGNDKGNDHHFHYGYYLRAASVLISLRPKLRSQIEPIINELALDIANINRSNTRYPYMRNFSPYDGHSWADGFAPFADGNNQESTSEALNAWYGIWMWGMATNNQALQDTGAILFAIELIATKAYWFGENNLFPDGYSHTIASLVWGGKRDYATWFSGEAMHIHGIQWLPITPASDYLRSLPNFAERKREILSQHPKPALHEWGDLYTAYLSFIDPMEAREMLNVARDKQALKSKALLYQTVYKNTE